jgi:hypothetical protein
MLYMYMWYTCTTCTTCTHGYSNRVQVRVDVWYMYVCYSVVPRVYHIKFCIFFKYPGTHNTQ